MYLGDFEEDKTVYIMFNTYTSDDPSASSTITNLLNTDVFIHKDDSLAPRNNAAGVTVSVDFDGITGSHMIKIDTSDDTVAGFWIVGHDYFVRIEGTTIDGATINSVVGQFSIENRFNEVNVVQIEGADPSDTIRDAVVDDVTRIDASALNTLSGHDPGAVIAKAGDAMALTAAATSAQLVDDIWDEIITGVSHNIATSAGRRLRELGANHISSGTAQAGTAYGITLEAGELAIDHIYNRNLLVILAGTGMGQTRTIVDYDGATKIAVIDRNWWVNPDATSEYSIIPDDTPLVTDHGVATAGTGDTITIRASASAISSTYANSIIMIMAGTGQGQSRLIESYVGATKVVTICSSWTTNPDNTSVYVIMPYGVTQVCNISPDPLADIRTQADDALSAIHLDDFIQLALTVNDGAPNAADFITDSAVVVDDWFNGTILLFTSGAMAGLARMVDDYDGATKRIYLENAFPQAPANTDDFVIVGIEALSGVGATPADIADAVWDELEAGHTLAGSFGQEVTQHGKKLDRNFVWGLP